MRRVPSASLTDEKTEAQENTCLHCTMAIYSNERALDGHMPSGGEGG